MSSVHLSHVDFNPQFTDEDEAELEREEWEQQQDLKEFLEREMGDDTFEVSFASYHSQSNHSAEKLPQVNDRDTQMIGMKENHPDTYQNGPYDSKPVTSKPVTSMNGMPNSHRNYLKSNSYGSPGSNNSGQGNSPSQDFYNISNHYATSDRYNTGVAPNETYQKDGKQYIEDSQLCVLYNARGKKIESLEIEKVEQKEKLSKDIRVLQHKLTMVTSEKDGLATSNQQQQNIIVEHKQDIALLEKELSKEKDGKLQLNNEIKELNEKLFASDCAVDTLQQQIKQLNQTESISRARAQHESMLATMRQRYDEKVLTLEEKLDDLQQALAWKTEDVNRFREMLDSNSSVSEIGILRNRLNEEEKKNNELNLEVERNHSKYVESEEQLKLYEGLLKMQAAQLTSTPLNAAAAAGAVMDKIDLDKTPCTTNPRPQDMDTGLGPCDTSFREELVKSLSINREKRQQIHVLRDQLEYFQKQIHGKKAISVEDRNTQTDSGDSNDYCDQCKNIQCLLDEKVEELKRVSNTFKDDINELEKNKAELRTNMSEMVKNNDKQKVVDMQNQNKATLQLIDDVKAKLLDDVQNVHEDEKNQLLTEIDKLNGELLHTKEDYLKLCTEVKDLEDNLRKEFDVERKQELEEMKQTLGVEYDNKLSEQEVKLTNKYFDDLENERLKWKDENEKESTDKIEKSLMLAKTDWIESYNSKRGCNVNDEEKNELVVLKEKCATLEETIKEFEAKFTGEQEAFKDQLAVAKESWDSEQKKSFDVKIEELHQDIETKEKEKMKNEIQFAIKECNDKWEKEIKKKEISLSEQSSLLRKVELDLKLKTALWNRNESEMKRKIESLQNDANKKGEKCEQTKHNNDSKESLSISENEMCETCLASFKKQETLWQVKEKELHSLLDEAHKQIRLKLTDLKSQNPTTSSDNEDSGKPKQEEMAAEVVQWKERYEESETRNTDLNNSIISIRDDIVFTESCYERKLDLLQKQLAKTEEMLTETEVGLAEERKRGDALEEKNDKLEKLQISLKHNMHVVQDEKSTLERKTKKQLETLQSQISDRKQILSNLHSELEKEREKYIKLKVDYDKLSRTSNTSGNSSLVASTKQSMDSDYGRLKDLSSECNNWKLKYQDVEIENTELERNLQLQLSNVTKTESYFKKQVETLKSEIENLNKALSQVQNELFAEKERSTKLDVECKQITQNYNLNLENVLNVEKQKWHLESAKLQEAVLKASEIDHNNFVKEIQSQTNHINEISKIKEENDVTVRNLKQGFREKLTRITEMKKKWIKEEEEKRSQIEKKIKEKYSFKLTEIQEQHENTLREQQAHWIKEIHQSKKEHLSILAGLREELKTKDNLVLRERKTFRDDETTQNQKLKELAIQHSQEIEKLKIEHLDNLKNEKNRIEQYFKLLRTNNNFIQSERKETSQNCKEVIELPEKDNDASERKLSGGEKTRLFYMETLERIQEDVMHHIAVMRTNADNEIKDAVEKERHKIYLELRERSVATSSPKMNCDAFGSPTLTNSMINGSCMNFKDLPHDG